MSDKVQIIKEEIEYCLSSGKYSINSKQALEDIIVFINSLPEESISDEEIEALNDVRHLNPALDSLYWKLKKS